MPSRKKHPDRYDRSYFQKFDEALREGSARVTCPDKKTARTVSREFYNLRETLRERGAMGDDDAAILAAKYESVKISNEGDTLILWNTNAETFA